MQQLKSEQGIALHSNLWYLTFGTNAVPWPVYTLKALIANLLAAKGLTWLRARLRACVKGLMIIIDFICNLLRSPQSHLLATSLNVLVLWKYFHCPVMGTFVFIYLGQHLHQFQLSIDLCRKWPWRMFVLTSGEFCECHWLQIRLKQLRDQNG